MPFFCKNGCKIRHGTDKSVPYGGTFASLAKGGGTAKAVTEGLEKREDGNPLCHFVTFPLYKGDGRSDVYFSTHK